MLPDLQDWALGNMTTKHWKVEKNGPAVYRTPRFTPQQNQVQQALGI